MENIEEVTELWLFIRTYIRKMNWMITRFIVLIAQMAFGIFGKAQLSKTLGREDFDVSKLAVRRIRIPEVDTTITLTNVTGITIIDSRPDTMAIGLMQNHPMKKPGFYIVDGGMKNALTTIVSKYLVFKRIDSPNVLMVLKKFWLVDQLEEQGNNAEIGIKKMSRDESNLFCGATIKVEFYYKNGANYYPLYRFDSTISVNANPIDQGPALLLLYLENALFKLIKNDADLEKYGNGKALTWQEIRSYNESLFANAALCDTVAKKGVYMTFSEFKNNRPSVTSFEIKKSRIADLLYIKGADGREYLERSVWGYCDGAKKFVRCGDNFFLLQKRHNSFYIYGAKKLTFNNPPSTPVGVYIFDPEDQSSLLFDPSKNPAGYRLALNPYVLDWDSGKLF